MVLGTLTILAAAQIPKLRIVTDLKSLVPPDHVYQEDRRISQDFDLHDHIIVALVCEEGVFNAPLLTYLKNLTTRFQSIPDVYRVRSLFSEDNFLNTPDGLQITPFLNELSPRSIAQTRESILEFPAVQGILVSKDLKCTGLLVELESDADKSRVYSHIQKVLQVHVPPNGARIHISGLPVFEGVLGDYILRDLTVMLPLVSIVLATLLYFSYRSSVLVLVCLIEAAVVNVWTIGLMSFLSIPFYIIHATMPVVAMAIAVADEIHIYSRYVEETDKPSTSGTDVLTVMLEMWRPILLTSVTTAIGFLSFLTSSMKPLRVFGLFTAFAVIGAMVFSLSVTPIVLKWAYRKRLPCRKSTAIHRLCEKLGAFHLRHRTSITIFLVVVIFVSLAGSSRVFVQDSWLSNFKRSSGVFLDTQEINVRLHGTRMIQLVLDSGRSGGIKDPLILRQISKLQSDIEKVSAIGGSFSLADVLMKMNFELVGEYDLPEDANTVAQYLFLLEGGTYESFFDFDSQKTRIVIICKKGDYLTGHTVISAINAALTDMPPGVNAHLGGDFTLGYHWVGLLGIDQLKSFVAAIFLVFSAVSISFHSFRRAVLVTFPIALAVVMNFAVMGYARIPLSVATSMFSSIIFGVGIDYAIHLQSRFDLAVVRESRLDAAKRAFGTAGEVIFWDALVVIAGFSVLLASYMPPNQRLGLIVSAGIATSAVGTFVVVPLFWTREGKI